MKEINHVFRVFSEVTKDQIEKLDVADKNIEASKRNANKGRNNLIAALRKQNLPLVIKATIFGSCVGVMIGPLTLLAVGMFTF